MKKDTGRVRGELTRASAPHPARTGRHCTQDLVAVLEADPGGHRLHYVRHIVEAAGPGRCQVLLSRDAVSSAEYSTHADLISECAEVLPDDGGHRSRLGAAVENARSFGAATLILTDGDRYLLPLLLRAIRRPHLPLDIRLLLMRTSTIGGPESLRPAMVVKPVLVQLLRMFRRIHILFLTDALGVVTKRRGFPGIPAVKDPVSPPVESMHRRPAWFPPHDPGTTVVGVFGFITARKNLPLLVGAVASLPDVTVVVGGRLDVDVRAFVDTNDLALRLIRERRIVIVDRLLSASEFASGLAAADMVAVLHDNDSPSGILAEACVRHTPVLAPIGGWLARVTATTGIGLATPLTVAGVAEGIQLVAGNLATYTDASRRHAPHINVIAFTDAMLGSPSPALGEGSF